MNKLLSSNTIATSFPTKILDFSMHFYQDTFIGDILEQQNDILLDIYVYAYLKETLLIGLFAIILRDSALHEVYGSLILR